MFAAKRVTKLFGRVPVLKNLDLELTEGKLHVVFGHIKAFHKMRHGTRLQIPV